MPWGQHLDLMASGPDAIEKLSNQQGRWAQINNETDVGNFNRQAQAQEVQRNWLQAQADRATAAAQASDELDAKLAAHTQTRADQQAANAEDARRFGIKTEMDKSAQAIDKARYDFAQKEKEKQDREYETATKNFADATKDQVAKYGLEHDNSLKELNKAEAERATVLANAESNLPKGGKVQFNTAVRQWEAAKGHSLTDLEVAALKKSNEDLAAVEARVRSLTEQHTEVAKNFQSMHGMFSKFPYLTPTSDAQGWHIVDTRTNTKYRGDSGAATKPLSFVPSRGDFQVSEAQNAGPSTARYGQAPIPVPASVPAPVSGNTLVIGPDGELDFAK